MNSNILTENVNSVFEREWWLNVVAKNAWREITISEGGEIIARWPVVDNNNGIGMPRMTQTLGFWISEKIIETDKCYNHRKRITKLLLEQLPNNININICLDSKVNYFLPLYWSSFNIIPHVSYRLTDLKDMDSVYSGFSGIVKDNIKRASKRVIIKEIDDISILLGLLDKTFSRQNMKNPWNVDLIRSIYKSGREHNACKLLYAEDTEGNIHSGNLFVYDDKICYDLISGTDPLYRPSGAATLLVYEGIKFASTVSESFDFEGSMIEGIENFLRQFGGKQIVYYQVQKQRKNILTMAYIRIVQYLKEIVKSLIGYNNWYRNNS